MKEPKAPWNPINFECPACFAKPGDKCTQATEVSRRPVAWVHYSREVMASDAYRRENGWTK